MILQFKGETKEVEKGIEVLAPQLGFVVSADGLTVQVDKNNRGIHIEAINGEYFI